MPVGIEAWVAQIPPITRGWLGLSVLTSLAVQTQLLQPWRAGTTFFYFGPISLDFVFHLFFLYAPSSMIGNVVLTSYKHDYFWLLLLSSVMLLVYNLSSLHRHTVDHPPLCRPSPRSSTSPSSPQSLAFVPIYLWSRRHPSTPISLFGLFTITAPYLPIALVAFSWILNGTWKAAAGDLVGCAVGHVGWFLRDVWTREMMGGPTVFSEAPVRLDTLRRVF
ncbi:Der1-like protein [Mycena filopes]|nr:Der1-like protein [Mycena filopes]